MLRDIYLPRNAKQFTITKFAEQFKAHPKLNIYKQIQTTLFMTLISSQFFFFKEDCFLFLKNSGVFVNGKICTNPYKLLIPGDIIQLPVLNTFYNYFFKLNRLNFYFFKKYNLKLHKLFLSKKRRFRTRSYLTPKWIHKLAFVGEDIPTNLEVDFTILTIILLYECNTAHDIHTNIAKYTLLYLHRTYNWRTLA